MSSRPDVESRVRRVVSEALGVPLDFKLSSTFKSLSADSLASIALVTAVEVEFGIQISDGEHRATSTPEDMVQLVCEIVARQRRRTRK